MTMPPGQPHRYATETRHRGRDLLGATLAVVGIALMLYGAFAASFALGCAMLGALMVGSGVVLAYEPAADRQRQPPVR